MTARRLALPVAVVFAAVLLVGSLVAPAPPGVGASGASVLAWAHDHGDAIRWQAWLVMLSSLAGGTLVALVHRHVSRGPEATAYLVGAVLSVTVVAVATLVRLALARTGMGTGDPAHARLLADLDAYWAPLVTFPIALQAAALAVAARRGSLPRWVGAISLVLLAEQLAESATIFGSHGFFAPGGSMNTDLGPLLYVVWLVAQGAALSRSTPAGPGSRDDGRGT
ncbi:MAG: hypothetical protein JWM31_212 [Solirubrobacterales bacterium]|nr:hypothetical protein [Solirubrobacterales bacterium]